MLIIFQVMPQTFLCTLVQQSPALAHFSISLPIISHCVTPLLPMREDHQRRLLQAQLGPKGHVSAIARQKRASTEVIRRACSQGRWHLFNIPCGLSSCSQDVWQEPYLYF